MDLRKLFKKKKGQAGLTLLLSIISMLFMIGIIIMVYVIAGAKLQGSITDNEAKSVINETTQALSTVTDWFPTFIVLASLVVLILLVVVIINSIRGAGIQPGGGA